MQTAFCPTVSPWQVPLRLGKACCRMLDTPWQHAQYLALRSWYALLLSSSEAGITASDERDTSRPRSRIALSMGQQLQESGLLQRLPGLMTATAKKLQAAAGINPAVASAAGPARVPAQQLTFIEREHLELAAELLRIISCKISELWNEADYYSQHGVSFIEPDGHLAVAGMQYLSSVMQQAQQLGSAVVTRHVRLLQGFCNYAYLCASCGSMAQRLGASDATSVSVSQGWMDLQPSKPNYILQCACIASTIAAIRGALPADLVVTGSCAEGMPLNPEEVRQISRLWQRCSRRADVVPDVCTAMVQFLGCSKETVLWAAGREDWGGEIKTTVHMMHSVVQAACSSQLQNPGSQQAWNKRAVEAALPLFWQLPVVALLWASQHPTGTNEQDRQYMLACNNAAGLAASVMYHSLRLQHFLHGYSVWQPGQEVSSFMINEGGSRAPLPAVFLQVAQPLQCKILTQLLELQRASVAQSPGALPSTIDPMPWGSVTQLTSMYPRLALTAVVDDNACNLHIMVQHAMRPDADPSQRQHAVARQLCPVFEDLVRGQAEAFTTLGRASGPHILTIAGLTGLLNGEIPGWQIGPLVDPITELAEPKAMQLWGLLSTMLRFASHRRMRQILESFSPASLFGGLNLGSNPGMGAPSARDYVDVVCGAACRVLEDVLVTRGFAAVDGKTANAMLPWLVLLGRGNSFYGAELQAMLPAAAAGQGAPAAAATTPGRSRAAAPHDLAACTEFVHQYKHNLGQMAGMLEGCLGCSSAATHLSNMGYNLQPLLQPLERMTTAMEEAADATGTQQRSAAHQELCKQLATVGELLCSFAHPYACNNPRCTNLSGPSEARLVTGPSTKCGGCRVARYCSRQCLKQHWRQHKPVCQVLAAAAATTAAAASGTGGGT